VEIGDSSAQILPVVDGYILEHQSRRVRHLGGRTDTNNIIKFLDEHKEQWGGSGQYVSDWHYWHVARTIKERLSYCAMSMDEYEDSTDVMATVETFVSGNTQVAEEDAAAEPILQESQVATAMRLQREMIRCGEKMFQPKRMYDDRDESIIALPQMVEEVLDSCAQDSRRDLISNVFLSGGVTTMRGFPERFQAALAQQIPRASSYMRVFGDERRYAVWTGGSVLASMDAFQESWEWKWEYDEQL
jgi:actin-related protein